MTYEEAIARIKDHIEIHRYHERNAVKIIEALDMVIEALEQPEIIHCKDCKYCDRGIDEDGNPFLKCLGWAYGGTQEEDFCSHAERTTEYGKENR